MTAVREALELAIASHSLSQAQIRAVFDEILDGEHAVMLASLDPQSAGVRFDQFLEGNHAAHGEMIALDDATVAMPLTIQTRDDYRYVNVNDRFLAMTGYRREEVIGRSAGELGIWAEAGTNFGVVNDDTPYHADCTPDSVQTTESKDASGNGR